MPFLVRMRAWLLPACSAALLAGCGALSHTNIALEDVGQTNAPPPVGQRPGAAPVRATFKVDGNRGNPRVLFFLSLSGGGSRAAYLSASTMLKLESLYEDVDLLREVDVISAVSGGSMPGAYYALSRDQTLRLAGALAPLRAPAAAGEVSRKLALDTARGALRCTGSLDAHEQQRLRDLPGLPAAAAARVLELCAQSALTRLRRWDAATVRELMTRNYLVRWFGNWFWPDNIFLYWLTAYDRSDIMAKTFEDNLYDAQPLNRPLRFRDLNPLRPYLIVNSTNATEQESGNRHLQEPFAFGSVFTFTDDDFQARLRSEIQDYEVARAVMASSAFPLVFHNMTLRDFRPQFLEHCRKGAPEGDRDCQALYLHVFDGGNSDNLGLRSIRRTLLELDLAGELEARYDKVIVLLVDAFTKPVGALRSYSDPRGLLSLIVDFNVVDAIDSLLLANRAKIATEFQGGRLRWRDDCRRDSQSLPPELCGRLAARHGANGDLDLAERMVFYHFGFDDVETFSVKSPQDAGLKKELDQIGTSFQISDKDAASIDRAVDLVISEANPCLRQIRDIVRDPTLPGSRARAACESLDVLPPMPAGQ